jgi:adenylate kinase family enzyme
MLRSDFLLLNSRMNESIQKNFSEDFLHNAMEHNILSMLQSESENIDDRNILKTLSQADRIIASLVLSRYLYPILLNKYRTLQLSYPDNQIIGGRLSESEKYFLPTVRTALFTLAGTDYLQHLKILQDSFRPDSPLFTFNILKPLTIDPYIEDTILECSPEFIYRIISGEQQEYHYTYHSGFPASLYTTRETWEDLCLNSRETIDLMEVSAWLKNHHRLKENPILGKSHKGYKALFYGPPGTGKTVCVGLLGRDIGLPVYRIDLSQIISKWVGETEKNLKYIFDLAANKNWILFFDEGDALFGKRSEQSGANDRYGNQEIAYLLQRMEEHEGILFLCTNKATNMDEAFKRRFNSRVEFFLPRKEESLAIWKKYTQELKITLEEKDLKKIVEKMQVSGASIKNFCKWMKILQYENLDKTPEQIEQNINTNKYQFLELLNKYFGRYEAQSLDQKLFG